MSKTGAAAAAGNLNIIFKVRYETKPNQNLFVVGDGFELGNWDPLRAIPMEEGDDCTWIAKIQYPTKASKITLEYKYIVATNEVRDGWEPEDNHKLVIDDASKPATIEVMDVYKWSDPVLDSFTRSAFSDVIFKRDAPNPAVHVDTTAADKDLITLYFQVTCPHVRTDQRVAVTGSIPELGNWDPLKGCILSDGEFPVWTGKITVKPTEFPLEYKFVIIKPDDTIIWEPYDNRKSQGPTQGVTGKSIYCINEWFTCPNQDLFKGLGVYVPIFSLRTKNSQGIGSYTDIKQLVDVCNKLGASLIQILPINDTTDRGEWPDSYPYKQVSCFALHPVFIDLLAIADDLPDNLVEEILERKKVLETRETIDYPAVYKFKMDILHRIFNLVKNVFITKGEMDKFVQKNGHWLKPYALFCYLRDEYGTMNYASWPKYSKITPAEIDQLCHKFNEQLAFIYWLQYIADKQYAESFQYASKHHVAIKGDLPIGVNINSVECWSQPNLFRMNMSAGAPPDDFSSDGQNWGFPTYNWEEMEKDGFAWWRARLERMSQLYHALRVDHILGFFRIWEIPRTTCVRGILGHFNPSYPLGRQELIDMGLWDIDRYVQPYVRWHLLSAKFGNKTGEIAAKYFNPRGWDTQDDWFEFKEEYSTEKRIFEAVSKDKTLNDNEKAHISTCLMQLVSNVLLVPDPEHWDCYHVRTEVTKEHVEQHPWGTQIFVSSSWDELPWEQKEKFKELYNTFTYKRHVPLWVEKAKPKLNILKKETNMLICAEDLGQITPEIIQTIQEFGLLSLRVQRMSKDPKDDFDNYQQFPYLSVACPSTHDCTSLRGWWEENSSISNKFWYHILMKKDACPPYLDRYVQEDILRQNLWTKSMWSIFLLQDLTGIVEDLRRQTPEQERINDPSNADNHWEYRFPYTLEELCDNDEFTSRVKDLAVSSHRF